MQSITGTFALPQQEQQLNCLSGKFNLLAPGNVREFEAALASWSWLGSQTEPMIRVVRCCR
eukprot:14276859-Alexandrium_andersonii.AAC.1